MLKNTPNIHVYKNKYINILLDIKRPEYVSSVLETIYHDDYFKKSEKQILLDQAKALGIDRSTKAPV